MKSEVDRLGAQLHNALADAQVVRSAIDGWCASDLFVSINIFMQI